MAITANDIMQTIKTDAIRFVDLRFTDTRGKEQHITLPASAVDGNLFEDGKCFDGSSIMGWKGIQESDLQLQVDETTAMRCPFSEEATLILRCDVLEPATGEGYSRDPRSLAKRAEAYLKSTGIADTVYFGPEPEFFLFDDVRYKSDMSGCFYELDSEEAVWNTGREIDGGNLGHRPKSKGGYFPVAPVDSGTDIRATMSLILEEMGIPVEAHHHEVAPGQHEVAMRFNTMYRKADEVMNFKGVVQNVARSYGKTATFMPKPIIGDNGSGMHCHQSLAKDGENIFAGDKYAGLSEIALYYIGGIIKHARALNAFTNPATNSYKRLVPGFEAPVLLAYSARNRSAAIRIPYVPSPRARRIEVRFPDAMANPYLAFSAMMMAGIDGIKNKIHPGDPMDKDLYDLPPEELKDIATVSDSLAVSLQALDQDREFLLQGDVFNNDLIDAYIAMKKQEVETLRLHTHPIEFDMYYSL